MHSISRLLAVSATLLLAGAGCFSLGGSKDVTGDGALWASADGGDSWTQLAALPAATGVGSIGAVDVTAVAIDPSDPTAWYLGTAANGLFVSLDSGESWQRPEEAEARSGAIHAIAVDPRDVCTYYVLKKTRLMKTTSCGREFDVGVYVETRSEELTDLAIDWYSPDTLYMTSTAGDVFRSTDAGATWSRLTTTNDEIVDFMVSNEDSRVLMVAGKRHGLVRSTDGGATWTSLEDTLKESFEKSDDVYGLAQSSDGGVVYMTSEYGLLKSADMGATWESVPLVTSEAEVDILAIAVDPSDANIVVYGTSNTLYRSTTGGQPWTTEELPTSRGANVLLVLDDGTLLLGPVTLDD